MIFAGALGRGGYQTPPKNMPVPVPMPPPPAPRPVWARRHWNRPVQPAPAPTLTPQQIAELMRNPEARHGAGHFVNLAPPPPPPPALAPPPPPPPPQMSPWQNAIRNIVVRAVEQQANQGAGHFTGYLGRGGPPPRMIHRPVVHHRPVPARRFPWEPRVLPAQTIYLQPLPGCTVRPNPIPPCSGTLTWVDERTVCCR